MFNCFLVSWIISCTRESHFSKQSKCSTSWKDSRNWNKIIIIEVKIYKPYHFPSSFLQAKSNLSHAPLKHTIKASITEALEQDNNISLTQCGFYLWSCSPRAWRKKKKEKQDISHYQIPISNRSWLEIWTVNKTNNTFSKL